MDDDDDEEEEASWSGGRKTRTTSKAHTSTKIFRMSDSARGIPDACWENRNGKTHCTQEISQQASEKPRPPTELFFQVPSRSRCGASFVPYLTGVVCKAGGQSAQPSAVRHLQGRLTVVRQPWYVRRRRGRARPIIVQGGQFSCPLQGDCLLLTIARRRCKRSLQDAIHCKTPFIISLQDAVIRRRCKRRSIRRT